MRTIHLEGASDRFGLLIEQPQGAALYLEVEVRKGADIVTVSFAGPLGPMGTTMRDRHQATPVQSEAFALAGESHWRLRLAPRAARHWGDALEPSQLTVEVYAAQPRARAALES